LLREPAVFAEWRFDRIFRNRLFSTVSDDGENLVAQNLLARERAQPRRAIPKRWKKQRRPMIPKGLHIACRDGDDEPWSKPKSDGRPGLLHFCFYFMIIIRF